jgi:hypothetical protein
VCGLYLRRKGDRTQLISENEDESVGSAEPGGTGAAGGYGAVAFQASAATGPPPSNGGPDVNLNLGECGQISCVSC